MPCPGIEPGTSGVWAKGRRSLSNLACLELTQKLTFIQLVCLILESWVTLPDGYQTE